MRTGLLVAIVAASVVGSAAAQSSCRPARTRNCVDFTLVPQISQQIVAGEPAAPVARSAPAADAKAPYTGPTLGIVPNERRAPEVGYRWAIN
jgi:hypothetical protein